MPGQTEHVDVKLPSGETVTALVPAGMQDDQVRTLLQQKHPEYFSSGKNAPAQAGKQPPSGWHANAPFSNLALGVTSGAGIPETEHPVSDAVKSFIAPENAYAQSGANPESDPAYNWKPSPAEATAIQKSLESRSWWQKILGTAGSLPPDLQARMDAHNNAHIRTAYKNYAPGLPVISGAAGASVDEAEKAADAFKAGGTTAGIVRSAGAALPVIGPAAVETGEEIGRGIQHKDIDEILHGAGKGVGMVGSMFLGTEKGQAVAADTLKAVKNVPLTAAELFRRDLASSSHDIMNKTSNAAKRQLWDAHTQVSDRVGKLINDISTADYQAGKPAIPIQDLWNKISDIADDYKANGKTTPKFNAAQQQVLSRGPMLSWKELHDLKTEIGSQWSKAADGSRDAGATNALRQAIEEKLATRAKELDRGEQYKAYNSLWSTLMDYHDGALGDLIKAKNGKEFFDVMRNPANKAELTRTVKSLSKFGLPEDFTGGLVKQNAPLHDYVTSQQKGFSKIRLAIQHPVTALPGIAIGTAAGTAVGSPWIGGAVGAVGAVKGAARLRAANAIADMGRPALTGEMENAAKVMPVGTGEKPTPPENTPSGSPPASGGPGGSAKVVPTVNEQEIVSALRNLGVDAKTARGMAQQAISEHPNDFDAALRRAVQGNTPQTTAKQIKNVQQGKPATEAQQRFAENNPGSNVTTTPASFQKTSGPTEASPAAEPQSSPYMATGPLPERFKPIIADAKAQFEGMRAAAAHSASAPATPQSWQTDAQARIQSGKIPDRPLNTSEMKGYLGIPESVGPKDVEAAGLVKRNTKGLWEVQSGTIPQAGDIFSNDKAMQQWLDSQIDSSPKIQQARTRAAAIRQAQEKTATTPAEITPEVKASRIKDIQHPERRIRRLDPTSATAAKLSMLRDDLIKETDPIKKADIKQAIEHYTATANDEPFHPPSQDVVENLPDKQQRDVQPPLYTRGVSQDTKPPAQINRGDVSFVDPKDVKLDPQRFQYKSNVNEKGVTNQFSESKFNENLAGVVHVFKDPQTNELFAVNGHHRTELAQRSGAPRLLINALNVRDAIEARTMGALQNMAEGRGTAVDAAKFIRDSGMEPHELSKMGISLSESKVSDGMALSKLHQAIFDKVATGKISEGRGVAIGNATADPAQQEAIVKLIDRAENRGKTVTDSTVAELARMVKNAGTVTSETGSLFGPSAQVSSLAIEKAEVSAFIKKQITQEKNLFGAVSKEAKAQQLAKVKGQQIQAGENARIAQQAAQAAETYDKLSAYKGPIDSILEKAARRIADGDNPNRVKSEAYESIRQEISKTLAGAEGAPRP